MEKILLIGLVSLLLFLGGSELVLYEGSMDTSSWSWQHDDQGIETWVVRSDEAYAHLRERELPQQAATVLPEVDLADNVLFVVFLGERPTGGYQVEISQIAKRGSHVTITVARRSPAPGDITIQAITYPVGWVAVSRQEIDPDTDSFTFVDQNGSVLAQY